MPRGFKKLKRRANKFPTKWRVKSYLKEFLVRSPKDREISKYYFLEKFPASGVV